MEASAQLASGLRTAHLGLHLTGDHAISITEIIGEKLPWNVTQKRTGDGMCNQLISTFYDFLFSQKATPTL